MNVKNTLDILQIILAVLLGILILMQAGGAGLTSAVSGIAGYYRSKRGFERLVFSATIVIAILFVLNSLLILIIK